VDPELERRNLRMGLLLFAVIVLIAAGTVAVAVIYNSV
jgi:hypothetical protein